MDRTTVGWDEIGYEYAARSNPRVLDFISIGGISEPDMSYAFNDLCVVQHKPSGRLFWGESSGCSCPTPFEEYTFTVTDSDVVSFNASEITAATLSEFERAVAAFCSDKYSSPVSADEKRELVQAVRSALGARAAR